MDEFELLVAIVVGIFKLIRWILKTLFRGIFGIFGALKRAQSGQMDAKKAAPVRAVPKRSAPPAIPVTARPVTPGAGPALRQLADRLTELAQKAADEAVRCAGEEANLPFVDSLHWVADEAARAAQRVVVSRDGKSMGEAFQAAERLDSLFEVFITLADQRRDRGLLELLGDADALAEACYRPIVDYCHQRGIKLGSDRTATCIGGDKLFILSVDDPSGLAPIVLPRDWSTEIGWWPALAHEIGHDFWNSVTNLPAEMRRELRLPTGAGQLPGPVVRTSDVDAAVGAWLEELFADAFGTMMLGPAYVATMSWSFGSPSKPVEAVAVMPRQKGGFEEHPPGHVRVVSACRLLGQMGYGAIGDKLEASWRRAHKDPSYVYFPTRAQTWAAVPDETVLERTLAIGSTLYETGLPSLSGVPLRSIPGLDFGPREHQAAHAVKEAIFAGRTPRVKDARLVIAGAVVAWSEKPRESARILKVARDLIDAVGVPRRRPQWAPDTSAAAAAPAQASEWRDAVILDAMLSPPRLRARGARRNR
jgi:hypothetical protein